MTCFWINSNPSGNLEESTFGSLIKDIFFITFLESGRVDFRMVSFGRDMQKSAEISAKILQAEFCSDSGRHYTRRVLRNFRFHFACSVTRRLASKSCIQNSAKFCRNIVRNACGVLLRSQQKIGMRNSAKKCSRTSACRVLHICKPIFCMQSYAEIASDFCIQNSAEISAESLHCEFYRGFGRNFVKYTLRNFRW